MYYALLLRKTATNADVKITNANGKEGVSSDFWGIETSVIMCKCSTRFALDEVSFNALTINVWLPSIELPGRYWSLSTNKS